MPFIGTDLANQHLLEEHQFELGVSIFREQAPSLAPFGMLASRVAKIIKHQPALAARLLCMPRAAFHAIAIYLLHTMDKDIQLVADALAEFSPVELLTQCFAPARCYMAALKRCPAKVQSLQFYLDLDQLLWSPLANDILSENFITPKLISFIDSIRGLDPLVWHARHVLRADPTNAKQFDAMIRFCRRLGVLREDAVEARVLRTAEKVGVGRYISKRLSRCVSPWSFDLPAPLTHIKTAKHLIEIASKYGNCLGRVSYRVQLGLGSHVYIMIGDDCVVELRHEYAGFWSIVDCERLTENRRVSHDQREEICNTLRDAGIDAQAADFAGLWMGTEPFRSNQPLDLFGD